MINGRAAMVVDLDRCTRCDDCVRACALSCPYDNVRIVEIRNQQGELLVDENSRQPIVKATKCDLCVDQLGGPACQRACPHDALVRLDLSDLATVSPWVKR